ncbi:hypothetical protein [Clostridium beijerinckii]|uniref:Uncharacterized protein n=1 Tax=Clostridium beijerinckii TaxID=1520 RepID=A0AAW3W9L2_CLOBE|nr:hypothetical protein [Clostridium beijerinckii]MBC2457014.1 hypothetical protein [Clostridium beijerinckii]MBC2475586.1 hypothetical protein [Clostridium beijerinckii]NOV63113.1 hypothetical protein [Clostridium beijerinckii]NOV69925.1 hypothetical protein [Clostridium beijerinckii]NOW31168.1 hypothetical protein [Clostridium beijerinckii]
MYTHQEERAVEEVCYDLSHIQQVIEVINNKFEEYFEEFIKLEGGNAISEENIKKIAKKLGVENIKSKNNADVKSVFKNIVVESIEDYEKDRAKYQAIFDEESLEEYEDDPQYFKSTVLKNECPIIHSTIHNKRAKELDKYRYEFNVSSPRELLTVVSKLSHFADQYYNKYYDSEEYDKVTDYKELGVSDLDTGDYTVYGVIGGGIKSHMLYKVYPAIFPNRSRDSIWGLWYLTDKKKFGCKQDSEFLMIDIDKSITNQNYFYPYELFTFYAHQIFQLINGKAKKHEVYIDLEYRYVIVDRFLSFIAKQHDEEIDLLRRQIKEGEFDYA